MANNYIEASFSIENLTEEELAWWKKEAKREVPEDTWSDDVDPPISLDWEIEGNSVWFHHDETIDVENAAEVIQRFLKECSPERSVGFCWSETCSKPRLGEFGGGAYFITAEETKWMSAYSWLLEQEERVLTSGSYLVVGAEYQIAFMDPGQDANTWYSGPATFVSLDDEDYGTEEQHVFFRRQEEEEGDVISFPLSSVGKRLK